MDSGIDLLTLILITAITLALYHILKWSFRSSKLPPGPRGLPILGSIPFMDANLHTWFASLAQSYGPVMTVRLGCKPCVVVGSAAAARELLCDRDAVFANRNVPAAARAASYDGADIMWAQLGPHWQMLRKVCVQELLSARMVGAVAPLRMREVRLMVADVAARPAGEAVGVRELTFVAVLNVMMSMVWGGKMEDREERERVGRQFREVSDAFMEVLARPNVSDLFPALARFDVQGVEKKMGQLVAWLDRVFDPIIRKRMEEVERGEGDRGCRDFLQVMVELFRRGDPKVPLAMINIKALFMNLFGGATDTTSTTVEWAMAVLLHFPSLMKRAQDELDRVVGRDKTVDESHIPQLRYLHAVMKEVLRLYPPGALVLHSPSETSAIGGHTIPKGISVFINAWMIHRDPTAWEEPLEFKPERFMGAKAKEREYNGNNFNFIPFGAGRRICVGISLAERIVMLTLASLLHSFDWRLPEGAKSDLSGKFGIVLKKEEPLVAVPSPRLSNKELYK